MKIKFALLPLVLLALSPAARAADKNLADYPLKLVIIDTHTDTSLRWGNTTGGGKARLYDGAQINGVEFQYQCEEKLLLSHGGEYLAAKWKKPGEVLTVISQQIGSDHMSTCDVKVAVHDFVYYNQNGHAVTMSQKKWAARYPKGDPTQRSGTQASAGSPQ
jgi:hypothetical protein